MATTLTLYASGTQTATVTTEHFLSSPNVNGLFTFHVDLNAMAAGDITEIRIYTMVLTGGTQRVTYLGRFYDAQSADDKIYVSVPIGNDLTDTNAVRFSLKQTVGTGRAYPWKVLQY